MGGKNKAERTKNNARPSNSGRTAELLGNSLPQFSGFHGLKEVGFITPNFSHPCFEFNEIEIDTNFQLTFKKMSKKDATTKLKALNEFIECVKSSDVEVVKAILPFWSRLYNVLAIDIDNKVREATHNAQLEVVQKVKKQFAPYLKQVAPVWFTSQCDTYPPAASAAEQSINKSFKDISSTLSYCNDEVLNYIYDSLMVQTAMSIVDQKHNSPEVSEAKYQRVLIACLQGYALFLHKIPKASIEKSQESHRKIINDPKFWKYSKQNESVVVRSAWFELLTSLLQNAPFLLENEEKNVVSAAIGNIDENDTVLLPIIWQNVLLTVTSIKEWYSKGNLDVIQSKLWKFLRVGGRGNATTIYPNLLPLISNLIPIIDENTFYDNFFKSLCTGLKLKSVISSKSEFEAVSTAFIECLQYVIMKNSMNVSLCEKLIKLHLISTLEWCLTDEQCCHHKIIFNKLPTVLQHWIKNESNVRYSDYFWTNLKTMFEGILMDFKPFETEKISMFTSRQLDLLRIMKHQPKSRKKSVRVTFDNEKNENVESVEQISNFPTEIYQDNLNNLSVELSRIFIKFIDEFSSKILLERLVELVREFDSKQFYEQINNFPILKNWLNNEILKCKILIDLVFLIFKYLNFDEKNGVLKDIELTNNEEILQWCLEEALAHPYNKDEIIKNWLQSEIVSDFILKIVEKEIKDEGSSEARALLKIAVNENDNEEFYLNNGTISVLLDKLEVPLRNPGGDSIDFIASFSAHLSTMVYTEKYLLSFNENFLISLIIFTKDSLKLEISECLSDDTAWEVRTAWQDALTLLSTNLAQETLHNVLEKIVKIIRESLEKYEESIERLSEIFLNILRALHKGKPSEIEHIVMELFNNFSLLEQRNTLTEICKIGEYLSGNLSSCYTEELNLNFDKNTEDLIEFSKWINFKINVINGKLNEENYDEDDDEEIRIHTTFNSFELTSELLYDFELERSFLENYQTIKSWRKVKELNEKSSLKFKEFVEISNENYKESIGKILRENSYKFSWIWCRTFYNFHVNLMKEDAVKIYTDLVETALPENKLLVIHSTQIFSKFLNFDYVSHTFDDISRIIVLKSLSKCTEIDVQIAEVMGIVERFREEDLSRFNLEKIPNEWELYQMLLEIAKLFTELIEHQFESLSRRQVDLIVISLAEWLPRLVQYHKNTKLQPMFSAVNTLYKNILNQISNFKSSNTNLKLVQEWEDLFLKDIHENSTKLWIILANLNTVPMENFAKTHLNVCLMKMTENFDCKLLFSDKQKWSKLFEKSIELIQNRSCILQLAAYKTLMKLVPGFVEIDMSSLDETATNEDKLIFIKFVEVCVEMGEIVTTMLAELKLGEESVQIEPCTDSFNYTLAYLMIWDILLSLSEKGTTELRYQYAHRLEHNKTNLLYQLLDNLFKLMPSEILQFNSDSKKLFHPEWFSNRPTLDVTDFCTNVKIEEMSCWIYSLALLLLPNRVSNWKHKNDELYQIIQRITSTYVTPLIVTQEFADINQHVKQFKNMKVKVFPTVREVMAVYTIDDAQVMELVISLPANYPLNRVEIRCNNEIPKFCQKWLFLLKRCLWIQNGRICDGLSVYNDSLDKKFEGFEPCCICYSVLHGITCHLPKLTCKTCKKKFHSACLYKWFGTSNNSSCPICRNLF